MRDRKFCQFLAADRKRRAVDVPKVYSPPFPSTFVVPSRRICVAST